MAAPRGRHHGRLPGPPLYAARQAAAARAELLLLLEAGVLQDAFWETAPQAALAGAAGQAPSWWRGARTDTRTRSHARTHKVIPSTHTQTTVMCTHQRVVCTHTLMRTHAHTVICTHTHSHVHVSNAQSSARNKQSYARHADIDAHARTHTQSCARVR